MTIFDPTVMKKILEVTCSILERNFYYDSEALKRFLDLFTEDTLDELESFEAFAEPHILYELHNSYKARLYFTCYFTSAQLRYIFLDKLHFTEQELKAFETFLPKYQGDKTNEKQQPPKHKRTDNRKFFK
jgi:hypothetical protein